MPFSGARSSFSPAKQLSNLGCLDPNDALSPGSLPSCSSDPPDTRGSYFPSYSLHPPRSPSPAQSDSLAAYSGLSPNTKLRRSQSSRQFSDHNNSITSSSYLTAAEDAEDIDARPFKSRRKKSKSLNMLQQRFEKVPTDNKEQIIRDRSYKSSWISFGQLSRSREQSLHKKSSSSSAASHTSHKCITSRRSETRKSKQDQLLKSLYSRPAPPIETRRWSSVDIGTKTLTPSRRNSGCPTNCSSTLYSSSRRCSILHESPADEDFIETVRSKLTARKVPMIQMETPATIKLRRASGISSVSSSISSSIPLPLSTARSRDSNPKVWQSRDQQKSSAYLITSAEIDSLTRLIERNLKQSRSQLQSLCQTSAKRHFQPQTPVSRPRIRDGSISLQRGAPAEVVMTVADAQIDYSSPKDNSSSSSTPTLRRRSSELSVSKIISASSIHQIIWEGETSAPTLQSVKSTHAKDGFRYERTRSTYDERSPSGFNLGPSWKTKITTGGSKYDHLSPLKSPIIETTFEWSESKPQQDDNYAPQMTSIYSNVDESCKFPPIATDEYSISENTGSQCTNTDSKHRKGKSVSRSSYKKQEPVQNPFISAVTSQLDVISFPALPSRAKTSDWISPLPDISAPVSTDTSEMPPVIPKGSRRKTLYESGLDITQPTPVTPTVSNEHWPETPASVDSTERLKLYTKLDNLTHHRDRYPDPRTKKQSTILDHPALQMRRQSSWGGAIGSSSGVRKSLGAALKIDTRTTNDKKDLESGSIVNALLKSQTETEFRRKSLSRHHDRGQKARIDAEVRETSRMDHSLRKTRSTRSEERVQAVNYVSTNTFKSSHYAPSVVPHHNLNSCATSSHHSPSITPKSSPAPPISKPTKLSYVTQTAGSSDRLNLPQGKSQASLQEDTVGIYITMTEASRDGNLEGGGGEGVSLCSVGCESHHCGNEEEVEAADWNG